MKGPEKVPDSPPPDGFPSEIVIASQRWHVRYCDLEDDQGICQDEERTLIINSTIDREAQVDALLHEALHACFLMVGREDGEKVIEKLVCPLLSLLRSNEPWWRA